MTRRTLILLLLIGILLASCAPSAPGQPTPDIQATANSLGATLAVAVFQTQTALAPAATNTPIPTATSLATSTPLTLSTATTFIQQPVLAVATATPTGTYYTATPLASSLAVGCDNMALIRDVTIPAGTVFKPGESFTKTWQISNTGTCKWLYGYSLVYASGDKMGGNGYRLSSRINVPVPPTDWRQISIELNAPNDPGTYTGSWRIANGDGQMFGATLGVSIVVKKNPDPTATPNLAQTAAAAAQQTAAAAAQQTAVQAAINTAVAQTQTQAAINASATAICAQTPAADPQPNPPCQ